MKEVEALGVSRFSTLLEIIETQARNGRLRKSFCPCKAGGPFGCAPRRCGVQAFIPIYPNRLPIMPKLPRAIYSPGLYHSNYPVMQSGDYVMALHDPPEESLGYA
jgi:hypothetical protein